VQSAPLRRIATHPRIHTTTRLGVRPHKSLLPTLFSSQSEVELLLISSAMNMKLSYLFLGTLVWSTGYVLTSRIALPLLINHHLASCVAQCPTNGASTNGVVCTPDKPKAAYCVSGSLKSNIIIRCLSDGCPQAGNCAQKYALQSTAGTRLITDILKPPRRAPSRIQAKRTLLGGEPDSGKRTVHC